MEIDIPRNLVMPLEPGFFPEDGSAYRGVDVTPELTCSSIIPELLERMVCIHLS